MKDVEKLMREAEEFKFAGEECAGTNENHYGWAAVCAAKSAYQIMMATYKQNEVIIEYLKKIQEALDKK